MMTPSRSATHGRHSLSGARSSKALRHPAGDSSIHSSITSAGTMPGYVARQVRRLTRAIASMSSGVASRIVRVSPGSAIGQLEPEEVVRPEGEQVRQVADVRELDAADHLHRVAAAVAR